MAVIRDAKAPVGIGKLQIHEIYRPPLIETGLFHPCTAPLNQDHQHDDKKNSGYDPDNRGTVHIDSLPSLNG